MSNAFDDWMEILTAPRLADGAFAYRHTTGFRIRFRGGLQAVVEELPQMKSVVAPAGTVYLTVHEERGELSSPRSLLRWWDPFVGKRRWAEPEAVYSTREAAEAAASIRAVERLVAAAYAAATGDSEDEP